MIDKLTSPENVLKSVQEMAKKEQFHTFEIGEIFKAHEIAALHLIAEALSQKTK